MEMEDAMQQVVASLGSIDSSLKAILGLMGGSGTQGLSPTDRAQVQDTVSKMKKSKQNLDDAVSKTSK